MEKKKRGKDFNLFTRISNRQRQYVTPQPPSPTVEITWMH